MWPATAFSVTRGSIQEILSNLKFPPTYHVNVSAEANLNQELLPFPSPCFYPH